MLNAYWHQRFGQSNRQRTQTSCQFRAQRLLASKVWAVLLNCCYRFPTIVLNAYWHQRFGQKIPLVGNSVSPSAQRLLASKVWAVGKEAPAEEIKERAQRLLASKVWAVDGHYDPTGNSGCSTPTGIKGLGSHH